LWTRSDVQNYKKKLVDECNKEYSEESKSCICSIPEEKDTFLEELDQKKYNIVDFFKQCILNVLLYANINYSFVNDDIKKPTIETKDLYLNGYVDDNTQCILKFNTTNGLTATNCIGKYGLAGDTHTFYINSYTNTFNYCELSPANDEIVIQIVLKTVTYQLFESLNPGGVSRVINEINKQIQDKFDSYNPPITRYIPQIASIVQIKDGRFPENISISISKKYNFTFDLTQISDINITYSYFSIPKNSRTTIGIAPNNQFVIEGLSYSFIFETVSNFNCNINNTVINHRSIMHEFMHFLGFVHEHQINSETNPFKIAKVWKNENDGILSNQVNYYRIYNFFDGYSYDEKSIMTFAIKKCLLKDEYANLATTCWNTILSEGDKDALRILYPLKQYGRVSNEVSKVNFIVNFLYNNYLLVLVLIVIFLIILS